MADGGQGHVRYMGRECALAHLCPRMVYVVLLCSSHCVLVWCMLFCFCCDISLSPSHFMSSCGVWLIVTTSFHLPHLTSGEGHVHGPCRPIRHPARQSRGCGAWPPFPFVSVLPRCAILTPSPLVCAWLCVQVVRMYTEYQQEVEEHRLAAGQRNILSLLMVRSLSLIVCVGVDVCVSAWVWMSCLPY